MMTQERLWQHAERISRETGYPGGRITPNSPAIYRHALRAHGAQQYLLAAHRELRRFYQDTRGMSAASWEWHWRGPRVEITRAKTMIRWAAQRLAEVDREMAAEREAA